MYKINNIQDILQKQVSRGEFVQFIGIAFLSIIGVTSLMQNLQSLSHTKPAENRSIGYGTNAYGR